MNIPLMEIGLIGLILSMIHGNTRDRWNLFRHDLSMLGARRNRDGMKGSKIRRSQQPELFNISIGIIGISFFQIGTLLYNCVAVILIAMALIDVGTNQLLHVSITAGLGVIMILITLDQLLFGPSWFLPLIVLSTMIIYISRFFWDSVQNAINTSVFQKISIGTFLIHNIRYYV